MNNTFSFPFLALPYAPNTIPPTSSHFTYVSAPFQSDNAVTFYTRACELLAALYLSLYTSPEHLNPFSLHRITFSLSNQILIISFCMCFLLLLIIRIFLCPFYSAALKTRSKENEIVPIFSFFVHLFFNSDVRFFPHKKKKHTLLCFRTMCV